MSRIYTRNEKGELRKYDWPEKITHQQAVIQLKKASIKYRGVVMVVHF